MSSIIRAPSHKGRGRRRPKSASTAHTSAPTACPKHRSVPRPPSLGARRVGVCRPRAGRDDARLLVRRQLRCRDSTLLLGRETRQPPHHGCSPFGTPYTLNSCGRPVTTEPSAADALARAAARWLVFTQLLLMAATSTALTDPAIAVLRGDRSVLVATASASRTRGRRYRSKARGERTGRGHGVHVGYRVGRVASRPARVSSHGLDMRLSRSMPGGEFRCHGGAVLIGIVKVLCAREPEPSRIAERSGGKPRSAAFAGAAIGAFREFRPCALHLRRWS